MKKIFILFPKLKTKNFIKRPPVNINRKKAIPKITNINYMVYETQLNSNSTAA